MTKPKCKTCARLRQEAKADADFIADMICKHYNESIELKKQVRLLTEQNNYLHWRLDACQNPKVERPETAFVIENPVITFPPDTITGNSADPATARPVQHWEADAGRHLYW